MILGDIVHIEGVEPCIYLGMDRDCAEGIFWNDEQGFVLYPVKRFSQIRSLVKKHATTPSSNLFWPWYCEAKNAFRGFFSTEACMIRAFYAGFQAAQNERGTEGGE